MTAVFKIAGEYRVRYLTYLALFFFLINLAVRLTLQMGFSGTLPFSGDMIPGLLKGALNDSAALAYVILLPALLILLPSDKFLQRRVGKFFAALVIFVFSSILIFTAVAEYFFWDEFSSRFNFIAVDYLIYTTEVVRNIVESYPIFWLLLLVFLLALGTTALLWKKLHGSLPQIETHPSDNLPRNGSFLGRLGMLGGLYSAAAVLFLLFTPLTVEQNRFWNEYAKNGVYELFSAYLNNQLDYRAFYKTIDEEKAFSIVRDELAASIETKGQVEPENLLRVIPGSSPENRPNVVIVMMESTGSKLMGENTPNLNALAERGLSFTNMMSTGTRTVRGIEAIMLSVPPTPGNSIVRRPDNENLFNLGTMFGERGYDRDFIYGGLGYFDNMNAFFASNGYKVTDKLDFDDQSKSFSNAWGQCDEDLYSESLRLADRSYKAGKPFHQVLLTTSNHRPFTFPEGKIDMEQGSRRAAVKYADYAIGEFMRKAEAKPWYDNTVFVFIGDHPSSIAGKTEVPADAYGIVAILYGPKYFQPETVTTLCSQIDFAPTLMAGLGWEYRSQFFGTNARELQKEAGRAWISTYQLLGFRTNDSLVVLSPDGKAGVSRLGKDQAGRLGANPDTEREAELITRTVAYYQSAYDLFTQKKMRESFVAGFSSTDARPVKTAGSQAKDLKSAAMEKDDQKDFRTWLLGRMVLASLIRDAR